MGLECLTKPKSNKSRSESQECKMNVRKTFVANQKPAISVKPGKGSFNYLSILSQMRGDFNASSGDTVFDASLRTSHATSGKVIPVVSVEFLWVSCGTSVPVP